MCLLSQIGSRDSQKEWKNKSYRGKSEMQSKILIDHLIPRVLLPYHHLEVINRRLLLCATGS